MRDPKTIRFNDSENPRRLDDFDKAVKRAAADHAEVIRLLVDAYVRYVAQHGHSPAFPVALVPSGKPARHR